MAVIYLRKGWIDSKEDIDNFLQQVKELLNDPNNLSIVQKTGGRDKTREFREKYGINQNTEDYIDQSEFDNIYNRKSKD